MSRLQIYWPQDQSTNSIEASAVGDANAANSVATNAVVEFDPQERVPGAEPSSSLALDSDRKPSHDKGLVSPSDENSDDLQASDEPEVLQFEIHARRIRSNPQYDLTQRARKLHRNNICPSCHSICIVPIELEHDANECSHGAASAALVAFECERCESQWPA
jgi:hypothetical protein